MAAVKILIDLEATTAQDPMSLLAQPALDGKVTADDSGGELVYRGDSVHLDELRSFVDTIEVMDGVVLDRVVLDDQSQWEADLYDDFCAEDGCGESLFDGEGWNGYCGSCADSRDAEEDDD